MNQLTIDVARERTRDQEKMIEQLHMATRLRALRRARRDAQVRATRVSRLLRAR